ncbi:MAG TPA: hypothetical protein VFX57_00255 [Sulfuricurvum sp.]|nr:hypothetical protein [Sulfuricurvum sp.]
MHAIKITTANIVHELAQAARKWNMPLDAIDFDLLSFQTYYQGTIDDDWRILEATKLEEITTEVEIRSATLVIRQEYQILIRPAKSHPVFDLRFSLATDKYKSKAVAIIDPASKLPLKKGIQEYLKAMIIRKKLRSGFMIGITDGNLDQEIHHMLLKIQKEGPLSAPYRLPIADFFAPILPTNDNVLLHYKKIQRENNLVDGVQSDDLILEYIFPKPGRDGRSCTGEHIHVEEPLIRYANAIIIDPESIRAEEDEHSIRFYATQSGYVERKNGIFSIGHDLYLESASFKNTGSIEAGLDKEIHVKIQQKDEDQDAVGSGVNIDVQKLDVKGTIGSNTKIQACDVTIGAQTHKKSLIEVQENATIHLHRGNLKAKNATIETLEAGTVEAQTVHVKKMSGGEIIAHRVIVDVLYSNATITALESIEIKTIVGNGNDLIINPRAIATYLDQITALEQEIENKQFQLGLKGKEFIKKELALKEQHGRIIRTQQSIDAAMRENRPPLKADTVRLMQYKHALSELKNEELMIKAQEESIHAAERELDKLYDADLHATITHHKPYDGHTRVQFIDPKTHHVHSISPKGSTTHIRLRKEGDEKKFFFES